MKKVGFVLGVSLLVLVGVLVGRTLRLSSRQVAPQPAADISVDTAEAARRLAGVVRFPTVSHQQAGRLDSSAFRRLHQYLENTFPRVHRALEKEVVSDLSLLYRWPGRDTTRRPILLMAHMDVVLADTSANAGWTHGPFSGRIADGSVWGRGTLDDKVGVLGILEAVEMLLQEGFSPARTVYLAFGHDEEVGGEHGARRIAEMLKRRGVKLAFVLDEGGAIVEGAVPGIDEPVALVGIAEKGYLSVELRVEGRGGHSALPPRRTSIGILSRALDRLKNNPLPARLDGVTRDLLAFVGPEMAFGRRLVLANLWLFGPLVQDRLTEKETTNATVRTTAAATMVQGGVKENVLPAEARAVVNFRTLPGATTEQILQHVRQAVDDSRVTVQPVGAKSAPSPVSDSAAPPFRLLQKTIRQVSPKEELVVAPYLVIGATDSRHYQTLSDHIYRFAPFTLGAEDRSRIHGVNERIALSDYARVVGFYYQLMRNADGFLRKGERGRGSKKTGRVGDAERGRTSLIADS